jgi:hypothetical protein
MLLKRRRVLSFSHLACKDTQVYKMRTHIALNVSYNHGVKRLRCIKHPIVSLCVKNTARRPSRRDELVL